jgi:hypothetical protein
MTVTKSTHVEIKGHVWAIPRDAWCITEGSPERYTYKIYTGTQEPYTDGAVRITPKDSHTIRMAVPAGVDLTAGSVAALEKSIKDEYVASALRISQLGEQLSKLQCLEYIPNT